MSAERSRVTKIYMDFYFNGFHKDDNDNDAKGEEEADGKVS